MDWLNGERVAIVLFFIGVYGLVTKRHMIRTIVSIAIMDVATILYFITMHDLWDSVPPIDTLPGEYIADPLPQAIMITAIVIGISTIAASLTLFISLYRRYGTADWDKAGKKRMEIL